MSCPLDNIDKDAEAFGRDLDKHVKNNWFGLSKEIIAEIKANEKEIDKLPDRDKD